MKNNNKKLLIAFTPLALALSNPTAAVEFNIGNVQGQLTSQLSIGTSMATAEPDKRLVSVVSGGYGLSRTGDDGRQNFHKGDVFSTVFKGVHDLELRYENMGVFVRGKYWYDFELKDGHQRFYDIDDSGRKPLQKSAGVALLDAFIFYDYELAGNPGNARLGRQVVNWGEGLFIPGGINSINPIDVAALRRPGAEVKEALMPVEMFYLSQSLTDNLGLELFYQLKFAPTTVENCGTFFAFDPTATGCLDRLVVNGLDYPQGDPLLNSGWLVNNQLANYSVRTRKDKEARNSGQFGMALRYFAEELNNTEFGLYAMKYHSRSPIQSYVAGPGMQAHPLLGNLPGIVGLNGIAGPSGYYFEHPEDIQLYGLSFQTNVGGMSLGGELSYRPNMPLQISTADLGMTATQTSGDRTHSYYAGAPLGTYIKGYERKEYWQAQLNAVQIIDQVLGASRLTMLGEVGMSYTAGMSNNDGSTQFGRDSVFGQSPLANGTCPASTSRKAYQWCNTDGFFTDWAWGYRLRAALDYNNVIGSINLSPSLTFSHDVSGYSANFTEDAKAVSLGLTADYLSKYSVSLNYTDFFDGKYNNLVDRDFVSLSATVSF